MAQTILLTGITGFIAKRIALDLLNAGHTIVGSRRSDRRDDEVRDALRPHLTDPAALERLSFVSLDLTADAGWTDAMSGIDTLVHTASPFPMAQPTSPDDIIRPAVDGTLRALRAAVAAGVNRVVLTSSMAAIMNADHRDGDVVGPANWTETDHPTTTAYDASKTLAERAAWDFVADHPDIALTTINPGLVLGRPLDQHYGTSLSLIERMFDGKDPMVPDFGLPVVDLGDVSAMHVAAVERPETAGNRYVAADTWVTMPEMARALAETYRDRKIPTRVAPKWLLRILGLFDKTVATILPTVGRKLTVDNSATPADLGVTFTPWREALAASADFLARR